MAHITFPNVNKEFGPEMKSTGEDRCFIDGLKDDFSLKVYSECSGELRRLLISVPYIQA